MRFLLRGILIMVIILSSASYPQKIRIKIDGVKGEKFYLYSVSGEKATLLDSLLNEDNGVFYHNNPSMFFHRGMYRVGFDGNKKIDFIYDGKDIEFQTTAADPVGAAKVNRSESNELFFAFLKLNKDYKTKSELLQLILSRYPKDDEFYTQAASRLAKLQTDYLTFVNDISQKNPGSFVARYIKSSQLPVVNAAVTQQEQLKYLRAHALNNIDFNEVELTYSDLYTNKSIEYLMYFSNPQLPKELLEKEFSSAVDSILERARINEFVYKHITEYLISGFRQFGFDVVLDYIVENYVIKDDICLDEQTGGMIKRRIDQAKLFKIGNTAPDITLNDINGKSITLSKIKAERVLVVFYSSQCPHCKDMLPELNKMYLSQSQKKFEILAVALENKKEEWQNFVKSYSSSLINVSDLKGWEGKPAGDYLIYATPSTFLLDKNLKIVAKPMTINEVKQHLH